MILNQLLRKYLSVSRLQSVLILLGILAAAFAIGGVVVAALGASPMEALSELFNGAFGNKHAIANTLVKACPLLFVALGICVSFRAGVFNIGGEGQLVTGALAAAAVAFAIPGWPTWLILVLSLAAGTMAGAIWAGIAGWLKVRFNVSEILSTIMLNYIATLGMVYLLSGPMNDPAHALSGRFMPETARLAIELPRLAPTRLHLGVAIAVVLAVLVYVFLWRTTIGYRIRVVGKSLRASEAAGINPRRYMILAMVLSGALIGFGGAIELIGVQHRLITEGSAVYFTGSAGFNGIVVALFGQLHPLGAIPASLLFGALLTGGARIQRALQVPSALIGAITGLIALLVVGTDYVRRRRARQRADTELLRTPPPNCVSQGEGEER
ncbi:ABC transporter permease [Candidatus Bipolaricaulota bacterium]|nr:ABC transporter permease [Candidatus Bipolaricaulota bacterium]